MRNNQDTFTDAYIEAIYFTECGPDSEFSPDANMTTLCRANVLNDCRRFYNAYISQIGDNIEQAGHDFWLTRNGHGAGFWDRPELYGEDQAAELTRACEFAGPFDVEFEEE